MVALGGGAVSDERSTPVRFSYSQRASPRAVQSKAARSWPGTLPGGKWWIEALSSEHGTHKTVKARFWPWLSGSSRYNLLRCSSSLGRGSPRTASRRVFKSNAQRLDITRLGFVEFPAISRKLQELTRWDQTCCPCPGSSPGTFCSQLPHRSSRSVRNAEPPLRLELRV